MYITIVSLSLFLSLAVVQMPFKYISFYCSCIQSFAWRVAVDILIKFVAFDFDLCDGKINSLCLYSEISAIHHFFENKNRKIHCDEMCLALETIDRGLGGHKLDASVNGSHSNKFSIHFTQLTGLVMMNALTILVHTNGMELP